MSYMEHINSDEFANDSAGLRVPGFSNYSNNLEPPIFGISNRVSQLFQGVISY